MESSRYTEPRVESKDSMARSADGVKIDELERRTVAHEVRLMGLEKQAEKDADAEAKTAEKVADLLVSVGRGT